MIPKIIHYIWLGDVDELPKLSRACINTWYEKLPGFEIKFWTELDVINEFDESEIVFFYSMIKKKKYAFAADFARCLILNKYGGVYLDTDIEVVKDLTPLLTTCSVFIGLEDVNKPNCAVIGATKNNEFLQCLMQYIIMADGLIEIPKLAYKALLSISTEFKDISGYKALGGVIVYPEEYFYPYNPYKTCSVGQLLYKDITENTYAIHHWAKTWKLSLFERIRKYLTH